MQTNINKNELILLKNRVYELEEQISELHFFLKDAIKMRMEMDLGASSIDVDRFLPNGL